jgi:heme-degrading monooxygenase HmoA
MITEHAWLPVTPGQEDDFVASITSALPLINAAPGCHGAVVHRQIEDPSTFLLVVRWSSVEDHMSFRASDDFAHWRSLTHPFYSEPASVTHFAEVASTSN